MYILVKSQKSDGKAKSSRCKARESFGMRRTYQYGAVTKDEAQRRPSALLRAVSMSNGLSALLRAMSPVEWQMGFLRSRQNEKGE
jgi:hypothetical protein